MNQINKTKLLFCLILILVSVNLFAQKGYHDIVYLKDGSVIHGTIIEKTEESIKIKTHDKNIFVFKMAEVEKFEIGVSTIKSKDHFLSEVHPLSKIDSFPYSGICTGIEICIGSGIGKDKDQINGVFGAHFLVGYMSNSTFMLGVNSGIIHCFGNSLTSFDFNLTFRWFPLKKKITPLLIADIGLASKEVSIGNGLDWGYTYNLGGGIRLNENTRRAYTIAICFKNQEVASYIHSYSHSYSPEIIYLEAICLQVGISF